MLRKIACYLGRAPRGQSGLREDARKRKLPTQAANKGPEKRPTFRFDIRKVRLQRMSVPPCSGDDAASAFDARLCRERIRRRRLRRARFKGEELRIVFCTACDPDELGLELLIRKLWVSEGLSS